VAKAYYGSKISNNLTKTPEGFLICHNVPIARTGWQKYYGQELGLDDIHDKEVMVYRSNEEVFHQATMASFEGKTITDEHPNDWVKPENMIMLAKGHAQNVRRGTGDESDLLIADIFITDPNLITIVEQGLKREVSCGYDCIYEQISDTKFEQKQIRGNHVAVVNSGRAGSRVAIKDSSVAIEEQQEGGNEKMAKTAKKKYTKDILAAIGFKKLAQDSDTEPEELVEASKAMNEDAEPEADPEEDKMTKDGDGEVMALLQKIMERLDAIEGGNQGQEMTDLDALEGELEMEDEDNEESITIPAEEMDSDELTSPASGFVEPENERPKNPIGDKAAALDTIRSLKPVILSIKDPVERRKAADSVAKLIRSGNKSAKRVNDEYGNIAKGASDQAQKIAKDSSVASDNRGNGRDYAKKFNPHYKEKQGGN